MPAATAQGTDRALLIVNPRSGGGKAQRYALVDACRTRGIEPIVLKPEDDVASVAAAAVAGADVIGVAGGDGSMAPVAAVAARYDIPFVCVPAGTRNHFAFDLGIDRHDVVGALDAFRHGDERRIDMASVNGRLFVNNVSMGWYGKVVGSPEYRDAKVKTVLEMLPELVGPRAARSYLRFNGPDGKEYLGAHVVLVSNNPYELDRPTPHGKRNGIDQGTLGVVAASPPSLPAVAEGPGGEPDGWMEWATPTFRVDSESAVEAGLDGEALTLPPPLLFHLLPLALRVRLRRGHGLARPWLP